jgi:diguanylate cyclase (GGDEF)-like protein
MQVRHRSLSRKLLQVALLAALAVGLLLSIVQIVHSLHQTRERLDNEAQRILAMFREPSAQAALTLDRTMAEQVIAGLFQHESIRHAHIGTPGEAPLAESERPLLEVPWRRFTDPLLGREYLLGADLRDDPELPSAQLHLSLDTALYGQTFMEDALFLLVSGILRALGLALLLHLIYRWLVTRPLDRLLHHLTHIDPERPGQYQLPMLKGHEYNELGQWIRAANRLLAAIEYHSQLRQQAERELLHATEHDPLTDLPNRLLFQAHLQRVLAEAGERRQQVAVLCLGLDGFREVNEQFGYPCGDQLLAALGQRLQCFAGQVSCISRLGGDQFALIQHPLAGHDQTAALAQGILDRLTEPFELDGQPVQLSATLGITRYPDDGADSSDLLQKAELTMTLAKRHARSGYQFYVASVDREMRRRRDLDRDLLLALDNRQLHLVYQPQIDYRTRRIRGVEVLLRWQHPVHGPIAPDHFIPLAEQNGSILPIGSWVLDQACRQLRQWHDQGLAPLRMAVNLSAVQLHHGQLPGLVAELLHRYRLPHGSLELEITETSLMEDVRTAAEHLLSLRQAGALIAIDDFGTGYSSLSYLKSLPLDKIKIDKSFVRDLHTGSQAEGDAAIVRAIVQLARNLSLQVIAEGVENSEQERFLNDLGCDEGQGYLYSKPLPARELTQLLLTQGRQRIAIP